MYLAVNMSGEHTDAFGNMTSMNISTEKPLQVASIGVNSSGGAAEVLRKEGEEKAVDISDETVNIMLICKLNFFFFENCFDFIAKI